MSGTYYSVKITPALKKELRKQRKRFIKKFGREPNGDDPILFDEDAPTPTALTEEYLGGVMMDALKASGAPGYIIYAYKKTGRVLTDATYSQMPKYIRDEWDAAVSEYYELEKTAPDTGRI